MTPRARSPSLHGRPLEPVPTSVAAHVTRLRATTGRDLTSTTFAHKLPSSPRAEPHLTPPDAPVPPEFPVVGRRFMRHHAFPHDRDRRRPDRAPRRPAVAAKPRSALARALPLGFVVGLALGLAAVAGITAGALISWDRSYEARVLPGVTAGGIDLSGMDRRPGAIRGARRGVRPGDHGPRGRTDGRRRRLRALRTVRAPRGHRRDGPGGPRDRTSGHDGGARPGRDPGFSP